MGEGGFLERKRSSPLGFALVAAAHGAALGGLVLIKGPDIIPATFDPIKIFTPAPPEDPVPPPPQPKQPVPEAPQRPSQIDQVPRIVDTIDTSGPTTVVDPLPPLRDPLPPGPISTPKADPVAVPEPVRTEARFDDRYADALQPPYPPSEQRAQRDGIVRLRVTIGTDGRVKAVERISATSDAFWSMAERHARTRWRFRPATVDGRPVESQKVMTLHFLIENA